MEDATLKELRDALRENTEAIKSLNEQLRGGLLVKQQELMVSVAAIEKNTRKHRPLLLP